MQNIVGVMPGALSFAWHVLLFCWRACARHHLCGCVCVDSGHFMGFEVHFMKAWKRHCRPFFSPHTCPYGCRSQPLSSITASLPSSQAVITGVSAIESNRSASLPWKDFKKACRFNMRDTASSRMCGISPPSSARHSSAGDMPAQHPHTGVDCNTQRP